MRNLYKLSGLILALVLSGCVGTQTQKNLAEFFAERDNPTLRYKAGGSFERGIREVYGKYNCDQLLSVYQKSSKEKDGFDSEGKVERRVILELASKSQCDAPIYQWRDQKIKEEEKAARAMMDKGYKDQLRLEEFRRERKEIQGKEAREKRERLLREIRNEK
jgi:hypothetical protein